MLKVEQHVRAKLGIPATAPVDWSKKSFTAKEGATVIPIDRAKINSIMEEFLFASMYAETNHSRPEIEALLQAEAKNREGDTAILAPWVVDITSATKILTQVQIHN